jgi:hypothetical protein
LVGNPLLEKKKVLRPRSSQSRSLKRAAGGSR